MTTETTTIARNLKSAYLTILSSVVFCNFKSAVHFNDSVLQRHLTQVSPASKESGKDMEARLGVRLTPQAAEEPLFDGLCPIREAANSLQSNLSPATTGTYVPIKVK